MKKLKYGDKAIETSDILKIRELKACGWLQEKKVKQVFINGSSTGNKFIK